jgi:hypothetical protein
VAATDRRLRSAITVAATALRVLPCRASVASWDMADQGQQGRPSELADACTAIYDVPHDPLYINHE